MTDADRLRRVIQHASETYDLYEEPHYLARAIVDEFELDGNCKCRLGHHCESCAKMVLLGDAIIDVAEADDE